MSKAKVAKRIKIKPFVKYVNYNHLMPTRYAVDIDLKKVITGAESIEASLKADPTNIKKSIKKTFEERYINQKTENAKSEKKGAGTGYFFKRLRF